MDVDNSGTMQFSEFLVFMFLWPKVIGPFRHALSEADADILKSAFSTIEQQFIYYDKDQSKSLSYEEMTSLFSDLTPAISDRVGPMISLLSMNPKAPFTFSNFVFLLYCLVSPEGFYNPTAKSRDDRRKDSVEATIISAFKALEADFTAMDSDNSNLVELGELTRAIAAHHVSATKIEIIGRLEWFFKEADLDGSGAIDFFEFIFLIFLLTQDGSYKEFVDSATDPAVVKKCFIAMRQIYSKYDKDSNKRLNMEEMTNLVADVFPTMPATWTDVFRRLQSSPEKPHIDFVRFVRLLYEMLMAGEGKYIKQRAADKATKVRQGAVAPKKLPPAQQAREVPYFDVVVTGEIVKEKMLGQGGCGTVFKAKYRSYTVAAKFLNGPVSAADVASAAQEVSLMRQLQHENIVKLIGACTEMPNVCILMEFCENGSLFDLIHRNRVELTPEMQWRFSLECARGLNVLHVHSPPIIHRDIKSLNVLVDDRLCCKVVLR